MNDPIQTCHNISDQIHEGERIAELRRVIDTLSHELNEARKGEAHYSEWADHWKRKYEEANRDAFELRRFANSLEGFSHLSAADVREELRLLADSMSTHRALAEKIGITEAYLSKLLSGQDTPGPKVLAFLKLEKVIVYREKKP